jgi:hypothetical protein
MRSKIDDYDQLLMARVNALEDALKSAENARMQSEESLLEIKRKNECLARINSVCAEQVLALLPLFGHSTY